MHWYFNSRARKGATERLALRPRVLHDFNSRARKGATGADVEVDAPRVDFNSRARKGATRMKSNSVSCGVKFQLTRP